MPKSQQNTFNYPYGQTIGKIYVSSVTGQKFVRHYGGLASVETGKFYQCAIVAKQDVWPMFPRTNHFTFDSNELLVDKRQRRA